MRELSLNVLDIAQNSLVAGASLVQIDINIYEKKDRFEIIIQDNGKGIDKEILNNISDPFVTTRKTRKVGMGLPLFKFSAEISGGSFEIKSEKNIGTCVKAEYVISSVDRMPLGNIDETILQLIILNPETDFVYTVKSDKGTDFIDTREIKKTLNGEDITDDKIVGFLRDYMKENLSILYGGIA